MGNEVLTRYPHLAGKLYNRPLMIHPDKLTIIEQVFRNYSLGVQALPDMSALSFRAHTPGAGKPYDVTAGGTALIPVLGTLVHRAGGLDALSGIEGYTDIGRRIAAAVADSDVKGILLEMDSPGGDVDGLNDLVETITRARAVKPVWALANESAFSAAYAISAAAGHITAPPSAMVGSIGVIALHVDQSAMDEKRGLKFTPIYAGAHKNDFSPHEPLTDAARTRVQALVDFHYGMFVNHVARSRNMDPAAVRATEAGVFTIQEAIGLGLVDEIASLEETVAKLESTYGSRVTLISQQPRATARNAGGTKMETITLAEHEEKLAAAVALARSEGKTEGLVAGATAERERIQAVEKQALPGHDKLINALKFDGKTTGPEAAVQVLNAERAKGGARVAAIEDDGATVRVEPSGSATGEQPAADAALAGLPLDERCKAEWEGNTNKCREEFTDLKSYTAFMKATASGKVRILGKKSAAG